MNNKTYTPVSNRIFILFLAIPIFIYAWTKLNYFYAVVIGLGSAALLYVLLVLAPTDRLQNRLRKMKFLEAKKIIKGLRKQIKRIRWKNLRSDLFTACNLAWGLVGALEKEPRHQGKVEENLLPMLNNMQQQIDRWLIHERGKQPLTPKDAEKLLGILMHYDTLFLRYQEGGIQADEFLTSLYHSETAMMEIGINPSHIVQEDSKV